MRMKRITISVPDEVLEKAQRAVSVGDAESVSAYFSGVAEREPDWVLAREAVSELVADAGGISAAARRKARQSMGLSLDDLFFQTAEANTLSELVPA